jgi:hypothetical protein
MRVTEHSADRYGLVFALLISSFVLDAVFSNPRAQVAILLIYLLALLVGLRATSLPRRLGRQLRIALLLGSVVMGAVALAAPSDGTTGALAVWLALILFVTIVMIVRRVLQHRAVSMQTIFGALSAYLLIGFLFAALYAAVARLGSADFFAGGQPATASTLQYFSFVTMTTTGYGDFTPAGSAPRSLAVLEALVGQIFLVTLVARLVAMFGQPRPVHLRSSPGRQPEPPAAGEGLSAGDRDTA